MVNETARIVVKRPGPATALATGAAVGVLGGLRR
jgi:hypothetical protein